MLNYQSWSLVISLRFYQRAHITTQCQNYNMLPRPAVVSVYEGNAELLVERETYEDLLTKHRVPERWLKTKIGV